MKRKRPYPLRKTLAILTSVAVILTCSLQPMAAYASDAAGVRAGSSTEDNSAIRADSSDEAAAYIDEDSEQALAGNESKSQESEGISTNDSSNQNDGTRANNTEGTSKEHPSVLSADGQAEEAVTTEAQDTGVSEGAQTDKSYPDGTYRGTGQGRNGPIVVSVAIEDGKISSIEILSQSETEDYWADLYDSEKRNIVTTRIIEAQSADVDAVSGATLSSKGIMQAVADALAIASGTMTGSGTARDPYVVRDARQLEFLAARVDAGDADYTDANIVLGADIDLSGIDNWNPIGAEGKASANKSRLFNGTFNGRGRTVSGMKIAGEYTEEANIGLFSTLGGTARISNVIMTDVNINAVSSGSMSNIRAGGIAGDTQSASPRATIIDGCSVDGIISAAASDGQSFAGGILGRAFTRSAIINSVSYADASATSSGDWNAAYAGSIAGMTGNNTVLANCAAFGNTNAEYTSGDAGAYAGGLAGMLSSATYNCYATGNASVKQKTGVDKQFAGIIAGQMAASATGSMNYYSSDAVITVIDEDGAENSISARAWSPDDSGDKMTDGEAASADYLRTAEFAEILNSNMAAVNAALNESNLAMREWIVEGGTVILSDNLWAPGEVDPSIFAGGTGGEDDPYVIETADQMSAFAGSLNSKIDYTGRYVRLDADIDISESDWSPIGGSFYRFNGDFDGNGHTISGLKEGSESAPLELSGENSYIGLFGWINEKAHIHDLTLDKVAVYTHSEGSAYVGGIAGRLSGSDTEGDYHGAIIDSCTVKGVISHVTDRGTSFMGGVIGHMFKGAVINTMTDVTMSGMEKSGELAEVGGIAGLLNRGVVANSYALGSITGSGYRDTAYDIEGMACVGGIAAVNGGYIVNCYAQGDVEALEYSIDTGVLAGWVTGIGKAYDSWYNEDASMVIDGRKVDPVDAFGETVAGGVSDEWGFKFPGSLIYNVKGYRVTDKKSASKVASGLNASFGSFPIDLEGIYGIPAEALRTWIVRGGQAVLGSDRSEITYEQPEIEKDAEEEPEAVLLDGTWYGRSNDKSTVVEICTSGNEVTSTKVISGNKSGDAYDEAVNRARFKARFGDYSNYKAADLSKFKGKGTADNPYRIENESQLRYLAESINEDVDWHGVYFRQTKNITVSGGDWKPIGWGIFADADDDGFGQDVVALYPFRGIYDGGNHTISGLKAGSSKKPAESSYMGLFGIIQGDYEDNTIPENGYRAVLKNIRLKDVSFYTENRWRSYIGGLTGNAQGGFAIDNCRVSGTINSRSTEDFAFAGGLAGSLMYGSVANTWTDVDSTSWSGKNYSYAGGMSAVTNRATIVNSYTLGDVHADADQTNRAEAGGFVGLDGGACINCYARGNVEIVSKYSMYLGGFAGMAASSSEHRQCYYNTGASQKIAGKDADEKRYAGKFVNESAEANAQAKSADEMSSDDFAGLLEKNRTNIAETLAQVRSTFGADDNGSSRYHSLYYNGDGSDLAEWGLDNGIAGFGASIDGAADESYPDEDADRDQSGKSGSPAKKVTTVTINKKTVTAKAIDAAVRKAGGSRTTVTKIVLGKKVKKISNSAFKKYTKVKTIEVRSKKLKKSSVKKSLKGSKIKTIRVKVGGKKVNKKYANKYKKIFTKKNAGRKVKIKAAA